MKISRLYRRESALRWRNQQFSLQSTWIGMRWLCLIALSISDDERNDWNEKQKPAIVEYVFANIYMKSTRSYKQCYHCRSKHRVPHHCICRCIFMNRSNVANDFSVARDNNVLLPIIGSHTIQFDLYFNYYSLPFGVFCVIFFPLVCNHSKERKYLQLQQMQFYVCVVWYFECSSSVSVDRISTDVNKLQLEIKINIISRVGFLEETYKQNFSYRQYSYVEFKWTLQVFELLPLRGNEFSTFPCAHHDMNQNLAQKLH